MGDLGSYLIAGRKAAGMNVDCVAKTTRIPLKTLLALETERWHDLPQPAFVRGFVIAYCRTVGLEEGRALEAFAAACRANEMGTDNRSGLIPPMDLSVGTRRPGSMNVTYIAILVVFIVGALVALLAIGTGGGRTDVSRNDTGPRVNWSWPAQPELPGR